MATAIKAPPASSPGPDPAGRPGWFLRLFDATFRFLASLKLAVISLATLAAVLCYATFFNSWHGLNAAQEVIYQSRGFAVLLAFLGMNILCAALIRFPWSRRQTGFVITHVGLLIVIFGSWWSAQYADEGQLGMLEGQESSQLIQTHKPVIVVKPLDPLKGTELGTYTIPFRPGSFDWPSGKTEVLSRPEDPFKLVVKKFYNASGPWLEHVADPAGAPMIKIRPRATPPGAKEPIDVLAGENGYDSERKRWMVLKADNPVKRLVRNARPAEFTFSYADRPEAMEDFLHPPQEMGKEGVARLRYADREGKKWVHDVRIDEAKPGEPIPLPDSDLVASFAKVSHSPIEDPRLAESFGGVLDIVVFNVRKGEGPEVAHNGYASLPMIPNVIPSRDDPGETPRPLLRLDYFYPPIVDPKVNGIFGVVEVMADESGRLAYRVFERGEPAKLRSSGELKVGEEIVAFGGNPNMPMTLTFQVEEFIKAGREEMVYVSVDLPKDKKDNAISAALVEMTVKGETKQVWLRRSGTFDPDFRTLAFPDGMYELAFDSFRKDLGFTLKLKDFDVGFDPGTNQASSFRSEVELTDEAAKIKDKPVSIFMNHPLDHRNWRFFQSNYVRHVDPKTGQETGEFQSVFQVAKDPGREMKYAGCIIVVLGAFVQFYMRAGLFSDGGKRERERAAAKARQRLASKTAVPTAEADGLEDL